jgi:hypothetical protein
VQLACSDATLSLRLCGGLGFLKSEHRAFFSKHKLIVHRLRGILPKPEAVMADVKTAVPPSTQRDASRGSRRLGSGALAHLALRRPPGRRGDCLPTAGAGSGVERAARL